MAVQTLLHSLLIGLGVIVALLGVLGTLGPAESIIVLVLLSLLSAALWLGSRRSARR